MQSQVGKLSFSIAMRGSMARNGVTIRDVAYRAGVSVGTASKAFNRTGRLADETRSKVLQAADELNYAPNALIRSLQRGKTHTIGVLAWDLSTEVTRGITMQLLIGVVILDEPMPPERWAGFAIVWLALAIFTTDAVTAGRRRAPDMVPEPPIRQE